MIKQTIVYWRDIPAQVIVQRGRRREKARLSARFQSAIDRAALRARKTASDVYVSEWRRETSAIESGLDLREVAVQLANRVEAAFSDDALLKLIRNHGSASER